MKKIILLSALWLLAGCSLMSGEDKQVDDELEQYKTACEDSYNDVNGDCANTITPQTY